MRNETCLSLHLCCMKSAFVEFCELAFQGLISLFVTLQCIWVSNPRYKETIHSFPPPSVLSTVLYLQLCTGQGLACCSLVADVIAGFSAACFIPLPRSVSTLPLFHSLPLSL
uniref:Uncharacterized protein n=1 Tax=Labrus bergylta TaxID=56723 RepID=A0A3Q3NR81_9LABR